MVPDIITLKNQLKDLETKLAQAQAVSALKTEELNGLLQSLNLNYQDLGAATIEVEKELRDLEDQHTELCQQLSNKLNEFLS